MNYTYLTEGASWGVCRSLLALSPQAGSHSHYPLSIRTHGLLHQPLRAVQPYGCYEVVISCILRVFKPYPPASPCVSPPLRKGSCKQREDKTDSQYNTDFKQSKTGIEQTKQGGYILLRSHLPDDFRIVPAYRSKPTLSGIQYNSSQIH